MEYLLRKIPESTLKEHWSDDRSHIRDLITNSGIELSVSAEQATTIVYALTATLATRKGFPSGDFEYALGFLVRATCRELVRKG
jgi:hypothetical protein